MIYEKNILKSIALIIVLSIFFSASIVKADVDNIEKQYIIITEDIEKTESLIYDEKIEEIYENKDTNDVIVANLTTAQAERIGDKSYVTCVEEDIVLSGSEVSNNKKEYASTNTEDINQWYLDAIGVNNIEKSESKVKIALLDSGVSYSSDVDVAESIDFVDEDSVNPLFLDESGHGSAIASVICAKDNGKGITGVNPNAELYSAKVLNSENQASLSKIIESIYWAIENDVDIINMSFGSSVNSEIFHNVIKEVCEKDILMIAAAGNTEHQAVQYPASYSEVIAVGGVNEKGELAELTSTGTELELLAPSEKIIANGFLDFQTVTSGTSIATAQVTGIASLLLQKDLSKGSEFIRELLKTSSKTVDYGENKSTGLVDYSYANSIYDKFSAEFNKTNHPSTLENTAIPEDYTNYTKDITVDGLWGDAEHLNSINNAQLKLSTHQLKIITNTAATYADDIDSYYASIYGSTSPEPSAELHGGANYVANLKYLWYLAVFLGRGDNPSTKSELNSKIEKAKADAYAKFSGSKVEKQTNLVHLVNNSDEILKYAYQNLSKESIISGYPSSRCLRLITLGYVAHLIGDIYSHRTIVPYNTVMHSQIYSITNQFRKSDFVNPDNFKDNYKIGSFEFRTLKSYVTQTVLNGDTIEKKNQNALYIDNPNFFSNRYSNAEYLATQALIKLLVNEDVVFSYEMILPSKFPSNSKLSRLKEFSIAVGCPVEKTSTNDWSNYST